MTSTPRFAIYPPNPENYLTYLAKCAEHKLTATGMGHLGPQPWRGFLSPSTRTLAATSAYVRAWAMELANPIANDLRGGLGAEMMLCQTAMTHPQRTRSVSEAEVVLVCAFNYYSFLAGSCSGHQLKEFEKAAAGSIWASVQQPPPRTPADRNATRMRGESIGRMVTHAPIEKRGDGTAWKVQKPTVYLGAVEYADLAYGGAGRPFGRPPPPFVMQANPSHWGLGMARHHAVIPYMTVPKLMVPSARAIADNLDASRPLLLFFRGSIAFGGARERLLLLNSKDVRIENSGAHKKSGGHGSNHSSSSSAISVSSPSSPPPLEGGYEETLLTTTFCLTPSGHTCTSRRFYDAIAAGCIPLIVDCESHPYPFDDKIDYSQFVLYAPIDGIAKQPDAFVACLRKLRDDTIALRRIRQALRDARVELIYGWWAEGGGVPKNHSLAQAIASGEWRLETHGNVLENLLRTALRDPSTRVEPTNAWQVKSERKHQPDTKSKPSYFGLRSYCEGTF